MIHAAHRDPSIHHEAWAPRRSIRVADWLEPDVAEAIGGMLRAQPYRLRAGTGPLQFLYRESLLEPEPDCAHTLCRFRRWLHDEGRRWAEALTGMTLTPPPHERLIATWYGKGCYLAAHNDFDGSRALAFVIGFTRAAWPAQDGGHLEFLEVRDGGVEVAERRPPGWNTLDLFDVSTAGPLHQIPILTAHHERRVISGWFHAG